MDLLEGLPAAESLVHRLDLLAEETHHFGILHHGLFVGGVDALLSGPDLEGDEVGDDQRYAVGPLIADDAHLLDVRLKLERVADRRWRNVLASGGLDELLLAVGN